MVTKKKIIWLVVGVIVVSLVVYAGIRINNYMEWRLAKGVIASGQLTYQIGLTGVTIINCFTTGNPPICTGGVLGGTLCYTKDAATCANYAEVSGTPAGGMGNNALFSIQAIIQSGLTNGGQLIAGGTSPVLMDNGVLASSGGCFGCYAKLDTDSKIKSWFDFIIAGIKESKK